MTTHGIAFSAVVDGWREYHEGIMAALAPLSPEQLELCAAPHLRPIRELAGHIVATRAAWFVGLGADAGPVSAYLDWNDPEDLPAAASGFVEGLAATWDWMQAALAGWSAEEMAADVRFSRRGHNMMIPRCWVIWHVIEHDLHHGGELFLTLGIHNLPTPIVGEVTRHATPVD